MAVVYIDMDGVLADFDGACTLPRNENGDAPEMYEPGFFRNLKVLPGAKEAIAELLKMPHLTLMILSKPTHKNDYCASEKAMWIREHFPELRKTMNLVWEKKSMLGEYLIDDDLRWKDFSGKFIHFDKNNPESQWKQIVEDFKNEQRG